MTNKDAKSGFSVCAPSFEQSSIHLTGGQICWISTGQGEENHLVTIVSPPVKGVKKYHKSHTVLLLFLSQPFLYKETDEK